jgi:hypothetical protein
MFRCTTVVLLLTIVSTPNGLANEAAAPLRAASCDPQLVLGNESCVKCHASEIKVWQTTPHARTFDELHRRPEAKKIAANLALTSIKHEGRCVACHYTTRHDANAGDAHAIAGVSCESCHGAAKNWLELHHDYGGEQVTRISESAQHRRQRIAKSVAAGMRNPANVFLVAQSCLRCHTTADEQLVNVGGHSPGSLDFEFVSWSQGTIRHNFVRSDGKRNDVSSPQRLRVMFVAGMIAELEASLRATAVATQKATYGVTAAKRAARAGARLASVTAKVQDPTLDQIVAIFRSVKLKLNNASELTLAADEIARLGFEFAGQSTGESLEVLDPFIPDPKTWK